MDYIVISGVKPYDGRWPLDAKADFSTREWGVIKRLSGYLPLTINEGFDGGDPELFAAFAVVALIRAGQIKAADGQRVFDLVGDGPFASTITLETDTDPAADVESDADAGPPPRSSSGNAPTNGSGSPPSSETSPPHRSGSGIPVSDISVSGPPMWET